MPGPPLQAPTISDIVLFLKFSSVERRDRRALVADLCDRRLSLSLIPDVKAFAPERSTETWSEVAHANKRTPTGKAKRADTLEVRIGQCDQLCGNTGLILAGGKKPFATAKPSSVWPPERILRVDRWTVSLFAPSSHPLCFRRGPDPRIRFHPKAPCLGPGREAACRVAALCASLRQRRVATRSLPRS